MRAEKTTLKYAYSHDGKRLRRMTIFLDQLGVRKQEERKELQQ